jgi:hypothetical protein
MIYIRNLIWNLSNYSTHAQLEALHQLTESYTHLDRLAN